MKYLPFLTLAALAVVAFACTPAKRPAADQAESQPAKMLVLYYSQTGVTDKVAQELARQTGADVERIEAVAPYAGTYEETIARCKEEMAQGIVPEIKPLQSNIEDYGVIFLGYPVWFGTYARPVMQLVAQYDFAGKTVVPFATFGSGGLQASADSLRLALPQAEVKAGFGIREVHSDRA
ncbi:MAG: NAD(P)H-dependent oxidoreductase, partial [Bacteroidales bacterium]|nr:NAD(P)H-dependent oxidoreductase [Bacteroidales bacterium]